MEACLSAHFISRALRQLDHEPWIIPAIYVKPFMKGQKNDYKDAEAIAEASPRPNLRTCVRRHKISWTFRPAIAFDPRLVSRRTATINQIRTFLSDQGIAVRTGSRAPRNSLLAILKNRKDEISPRMNGLIAGRYEDWIHLMSGSTRSPARSRRLARRCQPPAPHERSRHWPTDLAAVVAAIGTGGDFSAWLGLVPRQYSIGGRSILGRISPAQRTLDFPTAAPMLTTLLCGLHVPQHIARSQRW